MHKFECFYFSWRPRSSKHERRRTCMVQNSCEICFVFANMKQVPEFGGESSNIRNISVYRKQQFRKNQIMVECGRERIVNSLLVCTGTHPHFQFWNMTLTESLTTSFFTLSPRLVTSATQHRIDFWVAQSLNSVKLEKVMSLNFKAHSKLISFVQFPVLKTIVSFNYCAYDQYLAPWQFALKFVSLYWTTWTHMVITPFTRWKLQYIMTVQSELSGRW